VGEAWLEALKRAVWWKEVLGLDPNQRWADGNTLAHVWAGSPSWVWLEWPGVLEASNALGLRWDIPNAQGQTAAKMMREARGLYRNIQHPPKDLALRSMELNILLPEGGASRAKPRF